MNMGLIGSAYVTKISHLCNFSKQALNILVKSICHYLVKLLILVRRGSQITLLHVKESL